MAGSSVTATTNKTTSSGKPIDRNFAFPYIVGDKTYERKFIRANMGY